MVEVDLQTKRTGP